jgi:phosphonatase-like hydrolase
MIRLAVLDLAGTTIRDDGAVEGAARDALIELGVDQLSLAMASHLATVRATMGMSKIVVFRTLLDDEHRAQRANAAFEEAYAKRVTSGEIEPLPGAAETLSELRDRGIRICLTTGFSDTTRDLIIYHVQWRTMIDLALSPGSGLRGRPAPDLVLAAVIRLEIDDVRHVAVVGDSVNDLYCGTRAGAGVVAGVLTGAHDRDQLAAVPHTHVLASVADLPAVLDD